MSDVDFWHRPLAPLPLPLLETVARSGRVRPGAMSSLSAKLLHPSAPRPRILHSASHDVLDPLLLQLIALVARAHILPWYSSLSRDPDRVFLGRVTRVLIHVIQALELRCAGVDGLELLLDSVELAARHWREWDDTSMRAAEGGQTREERWHTLQPHIALSLAGTRTPIISALYLRTLTEAVLALLLPAEDFRSDMERSIVREIVAGIVRGVLDRRLHPGELYALIARALEGLEAGKTVEVEEEGRGTKSLGNQLDQLLSSLGTLPLILSTLYHSATSSPLPTRYSNVSLSSPLVDFVFAVLPPSSLIAQAVHYLSLPLFYFCHGVNSLIVNLARDRIFVRSNFVTGLQASMGALFPGGTVPERQDPTDEEMSVEQVEDWRLRCQQALAKFLPRMSSSILH